MPSAAVSPTKKRISVFDSVCAAIALKNCALVLIQLSASRPVSAWIVCAMT
jgi:predicted nucleic acid-binding protein